MLQEWLNFSRWHDLGGLADLAAGAWNNPLIFLESNMEKK